MIKYVVIDMSKLDMDKLSEMLTKAYEEGYKEGIKDYNYINAPTIPYNGDGWESVTGYTTTTTNSMTIDASKASLASSRGVCVGSDLEVPTITLANHTKVANSLD